MSGAEQHSLKTGVILRNYEIIRVLGEGGFGITYLAKDIELGLKIVIKEYFPNEFSIRKQDSTIIAKSSSIQDFAKGLLRFKEEAQTLAKFNHPSIVKILSYFEANDTAYFVMEYEEGIDLSQYLKQKNAAINQDDIYGIIMPILEGLKEVHAYNYLHRDIKPGNILLRANNSPVLIDFGASKLVTGDVSKSITSMLTEGYAPLEQYSTDIKKQGPFTDIYAVSAVIYKMITGKVPPSAQTRSYQLLSEGNDPFEPLTSLKLSGYDTNFLRAADRALSINGKDRPQNVKEFQSDISGLLTAERKPIKDTSGILTQDSNTKKNNVLKIGIVAILFILVVVVSWFFIQKTVPQDVSTLKNVEQNGIVKKVKRYKDKEEACNNGELKECANLGVMYVQGQGVSQDFQKATELFNMACNGGISKGCYNLGVMYVNGNGIPVDQFKAVKLFEKACDINDSAGCLNLGFMHEKGQGTKQNYVSSAIFYQKACELGNTGGCNNLGFMYENGLGVNKDNSKAVDLYTTSCNASDSVGCINLGIMYENGQGITEDRDKALELYRKGCDMGDKEGCTNYDRVEAKS